MSPDWASDPTAVPYASYANPQSLNLYNYMRNNPLSGTDPDGHCGGPDDSCSKVTVTATPETQASTIITTTQTGNDHIAHTETGPFAVIQMSVRVDGKPTDGVQVSEENQTTNQVGTQTPTPGPVIEDATVTKNGGTFPDTVGVGIPPSKAPADAAANAFNTTPVTAVDKQTQTLQFPG
jgi:hypothetical protein